MTGSLWDNKIIMTDAVMGSHVVTSFCPSLSEVISLGIEVPLNNCLTTSMSKTVTSDRL